MTPRTNFPKMGHLWSYLSKSTVAGPTTVDNTFFIKFAARYGHKITFTLARGTAYSGDIANMALKTTPITTVNKLAKGFVSSSQLWPGD